MMTLLDAQFNNSYETPISEGGNYSMMRPNVEVRIKNIKRLMVKGVEHSVADLHKRYKKKYDATVKYHHIFHALKRAVQLNLLKEVPPTEPVYFIPSTNG
jgi:hypothetical protein